MSDPGQPADEQDRTAPTEAANPRTAGLDRLPPLDLVRAIVEEEQAVPQAVAAAAPQVAAVVELAVAALRAGGRVRYVGAGTSGRLGVLDVAELASTYGIGADRFVAHLAGGAAAMWDAGVDVEDDAAAGARELAVADAHDLVLGLSASGGTPYVVGALHRARAARARTALVSCNPCAWLGGQVDVHVGLRTGAEAVTGSTRMKAATAQKIVLHTVSTATLVVLGHTFSHHMVGVTVSNAKLRGRAVRLLADVSGEPAATCEQALAGAAGDARVALVALLGGLDVPAARRALDDAAGVVRDAVGRPGQSAGLRP